MRYTPIALTSLLFLLFLLFACTGGRQHAAMQQALAELERCNQADSLLTDDSLAIALTQYFDRRGTANERMHAHYLLGRTYADRGEAPQAIAAYQTAAEQADTTAPDCDYRLLCRVYSQMGSIFYYQNLLNEYLICLNKAVKYGFAAEDTLVALNLEAQKMVVYERLGNADSVIAIYKKTYQALCNVGYDNMAAGFSSIPIKSYLARNELVKAKHCLDIYEAKSGYFDSDGNIERGREAFYLLKGLYMFHIQKYDSAEFFFRKELVMGKDFSNQNSASRALATLFTKTHRPDSAAKYALYGYEMMDSVYVRMATSEVVRVQSLYNYTSYQNRAIEEGKRANREERKAGILSAIIITMTIISILVAYLWNERRKIGKIRYLGKLAELERMQTDLVQLRSYVKSQEDELRNVIIEKSAIVERLREELLAYQKKHKGMKENDSMLADSPVYKQLHLNANTGKPMSESEWHEIHKLVIDVLPGFYQFISSNIYLMDAKKYRICVLLRLHINTTVIGNFMGIDKSYVSRLSRDILKNVFQINGASKELAEKLNGIV